jgi:hypothetical protein
MSRNLLLIMALTLTSASASASTFEDCYRFAYANYFQTMEAADARVLAKQSCYGVSDLDVVVYLWHKHKMNVNSSHAMDLAVEVFPMHLEGKLSIIDFAWERYNLDLSASQAASKAARRASQVKVTALPCLQAIYELLRPAQGPSRALDIAFKSC